MQIKIKMLNSTQEPPASAKAPNEDLKDMDVLCPQNQERQPKFGPYPNYNQDAKPQSGTSSLLQSQKPGIKDMYLLYTLKIKIES